MITVRNTQRREYPISLEYPTPIIKLSIPDWNVANALLLNTQLITR